MIELDRLGHLVLKVRDLDRSLDFYTKVLGLEVMNDLDDQFPGARVAFLANRRRDHHELALLEVGGAATDPIPTSVGLAHFAFRMATREALEAAYHELLKRDVQVNFTVRHGVTDSVYLFDPDGIELEVYVDNPPEIVGSLPNPYFGVEKLDFAPDAAGMLDAIAQG